MSLRRRHQAVTLAIVVAVLVLNLLQRPGLVTFDTKLDLQFDPQGFLSRSLDLWNGDSTVGGLQNQASGYLFPMSPVFLLGRVLDVPPWLWERLWSALVMVLAYEGARRLAARWPGMGPWGAIAAGLTFMLSPRVLQTVGGLSGETLPSAVLPWTLLPLLLYFRGRLSVRLALVWSAATVPFMGGQNATLVFACLVLPALLLLLVEGRPWRRRVKDLVAWGALVLLASLWWVVPLALLGGYAPPFLDFIESAQNTASDVGWLTALRGTSHWVAFFPGGGSAGWAGGYAIVSSQLLLITSALVAGVGLLGLATSGLWARRALLTCVLVGLVVLTLGTGGWAGSSLSGWWLEALDGPLALIRNIHKFDPVVRLPLSLGVGAFTSVCAGRLAGLVTTWTRSQVRLARRAAGLAVVVAVVAVAVPAATGELRVRGGMTDISTPWRQAASYLDGQPGAVRALVLPGSGFAVQVWGRTIDEPIQVLDTPPWVGRAQVTVAPAGTLRMLDALEDVVDQGRPSTTLAAALERLGVTHVVIRNDLAPGETDAPSDDVVYSALAEGGLTSVAGFGRAATDHPAVQVFAVRGAGADERVSAVDWAGRRVVQGGPEVVPGLVSAGLLASDQPAVLATDPSRTVDILTDSNRRVERSFGRVHAAVSAPMTAGDHFRLERPVHDYVGPDVPTAQTTAVYEGADAITASTSQGSADVIGPIHPERAPYAAFDDSALTAWASAPFSSAGGQWVRAHFGTPIAITRLSLWFDTDTGAKVTSVRITTDDTSRTVDIDADGLAVGVKVGSKRTSSLRITVLTTDPGPSQVRLRNVDVPDHDIRRSLRLPREATPRTSVYLTSELPERGCLKTDSGVSCNPLQADETPETVGFDRTVEVASPVHWGLSGRVVATDGVALDRLLAPLLKRQIKALGSSTFAGDPAVAAANAVDGRRDTGWYASLVDTSPTLKLSWKKPRRITKVRALLTPGQPGQLPATLVVDPMRKDRDVQLVSTSGPDAGTMKPVRTQNLRIGVLAGTELPGGLGISELDIRGANKLKYTPDPRAPTGLACGFGPTVQVGDRTFETQVSGTIGAVVSGAELDVEPCRTGEVLVEGGSQRVRVTNPAGFAVSRLWFNPLGTTTRSNGGDQPRVRVRSWSATDRRVDLVAVDGAALVVPESFNRGWTATVGGRLLDPVVVDGWKQAWVVPPGTVGEVRLRFAPQRPYMVGIAVGLALAAQLVLVALVTLVWWLRRRPAGSAPPGAVPAESGGPAWESSSRRRRARLLLGAALLCLVSLPLVAGAALGFLGRRLAPVPLAVAVGGGLLVAVLMAVLAGSVVVPPPASNGLAALVVGIICGVVTAGRGELGDRPT